MQDNNKFNKLKTEQKMKNSKMAKTIAATVFFANIFAANASDFTQSTPGNLDYSLYQAALESSSECINIKFKLQNDCYTVIYVVDPASGEKKMLVDGTISAGQHGVMFKTGAADTKTYTCVLEAYDNESGALIYASETNVAKN